MLFDFSKPITGYELLALILSSVLIVKDFALWVYDKFLLKVKLNYLPSGTITLMFNESGSYLKVDGVFEALHKSTAIKKVSLKINRKQDGRNLNLDWEAFLSPVNQKFGNTFSSVSEIAHPFRIEANSVACGFIEFADLFSSFSKKYEPVRDELYKVLINVQSIKDNNDKLIYIKNIYFMSDAYKKAKKLLEKELFWEIGEYTIKMFVEYSEGNTEFDWEFYIGNSEEELIKNNFNETLELPLKKLLNQEIAYKTVQIKINEFIKK